MPSDNALHTAAKVGNVACVRAQVGNFDINAKGGRERTALNWAASEGKTEVVKLLLTLNADVNLAGVSTPTILSVNLICISLSHISILYPPSYTPVCLYFHLAFRCTTSYNSIWYSILLLLYVLYSYPLPSLRFYCVSLFLVFSSIDTTPTLSYTYSSLSQSHINIPTHITRPHTNTHTPPYASHPLHTNNTAHTFPFPF